LPGLITVRPAIEPKEQIHAEPTNQKCHAQRLLGDHSFTRLGRDRGQIHGCDLAQFGFLTLTGLILILMASRTYRREIEAN
jgi:hypothetical protein